MVYLGYAFEFNATTNVVYLVSEYETVRRKKLEESKRCPDDCANLILLV